MKKRTVIFSVLAASLLTSGIAISNHNVFAKNQPNRKINQQQMMARYSKTNHSTKSSETMRRSKLTQMNVVSEAAVVLNVLPITIMDEMKKGKTLEQVAKEKGFSKDQFLKKLSDFEDKTVASAEKQGVISKKHADALKQGQKDRLTKSMGLKSVSVKDNAPMDMGN